jgi:electron transfer flavoprotein alpha subunit
MGKDIQELGIKASTISNISKVLLIDDVNCINSTAENTADILLPITKTFTHILTPSSNNSKNFLPRIAALLDSSPLTDVTAVIDEDTFKRPMYAGNAIATVKMTSANKVSII